MIQNMSRSHALPPFIALMRDRAVDAGIWPEETQVALALDVAFTLSGMKYALLISKPTLKDSDTHK
jgi:hypothetical protein